MAYSDGFYTIFHVHYLIAGSRRAKGLEPCLGSTIQENAFFSSIGHMRITQQEKAALMKDCFICNPMCMGTDC